MALLAGAAASAVVGEVARRSGGSSSSRTLLFRLLTNTSTSPTAARPNQRLKPFMSSRFLRQLQMLLPKQRCFASAALCSQTNLAAAAVPGCGLQQTTRRASSVLASAPTDIAPTAHAAAEKSSSPSSGSSSSGSNPFLDNLGTIFLSAVGLVIAWLVRSYYNTKLRNALRDAVENNAVLDPIELDELRFANSNGLSVVQYNTVVERAISELQQLQHQSSPSPLSEELSYPDFVQLVRSILVQSNTEGSPDHHTLQLGHLLDRVALDVITRKTQQQLQQQERQQQQNNNSCEWEGEEKDGTMPLQFWLVLLSLAVYGSPTDRIQILHELLQRANNINANDGDGGGSDHNTTTTTTASATPGMTVSDLVGYLQQTCQLVPDAQIVATSRQYPLQEYVLAEPWQLVERADVPTNHLLLVVNADDSSSNDNNNKTLCPTIDEFAAILRSKSVCAWGECYHKKKFG
jgi:hypothetical protein